MKTVYFVRHGESEANAGREIYHGEATPLTEKGREQARFIAKRCAKLEAEVLIASTAVRAQQTASFIAESTGLPVEVSGLFTERKQPPELMGRSRTDEDAIRLEHEWALTLLKDGVRVGGGENFADLKARVLEGLRHLHERPEERILVVSHGFFLHMLVALVTLGESLTSAEFNRVAPAVWMDNTGLTRIEYRDQVFTRIDGERHRGWVLRVWNDHAHLG